MSDKSSEISDTEVEESVNVDECVAEANKLKDQGNNAFKTSDFQLAASEYKSVLHCNLSASYLGLHEYSHAISAAEDALRFDSGNQKAKYRRTLARFNAGYLDEAKEECEAMLSEDSSNSNAKLLLVKIKSKLKQVHAEQKKAFGSLFDKTGGLYEDRAEEMKRQRQKKYDDYVRERLDKCEEVLDMAAWERYEEEQEKKREAERIEKVKSEEEKKRNGVDNREVPKSAVSSSSSNKKPKQDESDMDEEDQKIIQETKKMGMLLFLQNMLILGYCYFGKNKPGGNLTTSRTPQNIEPTPTSVCYYLTYVYISLRSRLRISHDQFPLGILKVLPMRRKVSCGIINLACLFFLADMSSWCSDTLRETLSLASYENDPSQNDSSFNVMEMLSSVSVPCTLSDSAQINIDRINEDGNLDKIQKLAMMIHRSSIKVTSVDDMECDAQIALIRATRRYMFDFSCTLKFTASIDTAFGSSIAKDASSDGSQASVYKGKLFVFPGL
ncbi:Peptidyl-prolyl cis-trans isomerase PASTICCINO1 [Babesia sp. Xinjiang]|uniref:Peptidyl-prolyl cis-trans isomerase PASTICCINO1 n=1 Tax=Babesia sp. Xinjiang TaxID=462227 RepID=UPI000A23E3D4|nr:Peptidyl-prolyl cis-trans isomerase PASTICCINO1 [Babesia sp. Xinjiang]ORM42180.1 Peptidyl-prolyl cis-trans isomerase PASTICCINO1 [Babesia sp. Xinjiang]